MVEFLEIISMLMLGAAFLYMVKVGFDVIDDRPIPGWIIKRRWVIMVALLIAFWLIVGANISPYFSDLR